jgi:hypothetical protein
LESIERPDASGNAIDLNRAESAGSQAAINPIWGEQSQQIVMAEVVKHAFYRRVKF